MQRCTEQLANEMRARGIEPDAIEIDWESAPRWMRLLSPVMMALIKTALPAFVLGLSVLGSVLCAALASRALETVGLSVLFSSTFLSSGLLIGAAFLALFFAPAVVIEVMYQVASNPFSRFRVAPSDAVAEWAGVVRSVSAFGSRTEWPLHGGGFGGGHSAA